MLDDLKHDFPIFNSYPELIYLDSAATAHRPRSVITAINQFSILENSNIHRGVYDLSNNATGKYEEVRLKVAKFVGSENANNIAFTKGTTESINIVAQSYLADRLEQGDNIVTTIMEHHANFIPWQMLAEKHSIELRIAPVDENGDLIIEQLNALIDDRTKLVAFNHISNTLGTVNDIEQLIELAHQKNAPVLIDAAQSILYYDLDVKKLKIEFMAFSGHKMFGPFGIGVLYVADQLMDEIKPYNYGGGIIQSVTVNGTSFSNFPFNMEAGTPNVSGVLGLGSAIDYIEKIGKRMIKEHIGTLTKYCVEQMKQLSEVKMLGSPKNRSGIISFVVDEIHPHDIASFLNKDQIAVRAGMHCTQPLLHHFGESATARASFSIYNSKSDVDALIKSLKELIKFWA